MKDIEGSWKVAAIKMDNDNYLLIRDRFDDLFKEISDLSNSGNVIIYCIRATLRYIFSYSFYCLKTIHVPDLGVFLEALKDKINTEYKEFRERIIPRIESLQEALKLQSRQYVFEGMDFYTSPFSYMEHKKQFKDSIVNSGILIPFRKFESNLLRSMYDLKNYENRENENINAYNIPTFLKSNSYATVINKLLKLPR